MSRSCSRRAFVRGATLAVAAIPIAPWRTVRARALTLRIGVMEPEPSSPRRASRERGLEIGIEEAQRSAALFGGTVVRVPLTRGAALTGITALFGGGETEGCSALARRAAEHGVIYVNVSCTDDTLRGAACQPMMFHVIPSDAMYRDAVAAAHAPAGAWATAWDASLVRFGADTLNDRFRMRWKEPMTADAWAAWAGVKGLWESSLRARTTDPRALADYLVSDHAQFDGHKGRALSFRPWDRQLRQPVYVMQRDGAGKATLFAEEPHVAPTDDASSREVLDRLGTRAAQSTCKGAP